MSVDLALRWLQLLPAAGLLLLTVYVPGTVALALLRSRLSVALAGGPLVTAALVGIGGIVLRSLGVRYGWISLLALTVLLWSTALLLRWLLVRPRATAAAAPVTGARRTLRGPRRSLLLLMAAGAAAAATFMLPVFLFVDPGMPSPRVDPMYHYNVLNAIRETGDVSMQSAVDYNYGLRVGHVTYPTVWHAFASLGVDVVDVVPAAHALTFVVIPVVFIVNIALLARVIFRKSPVAAIAAVAAAGAMPAFPGALLLTRAFWPNALGTAMLPGGLVVLIMLLRRTRWSFLRRNPLLYALDLLIALAAFVGLGLTHPSELFSLLLIALPLVVASGIKAERIARRTLSRRAHAVFLGAIIALPLVVIGCLLLPARVRSYILRVGNQDWHGALIKTVSIVSNWPTIVSSIPGLVVAAVFVPLFLTGVVLLARTRERRWIAIAWGINAALIAGSYFPLPILSGLSGLWYADSYRLFPLQAAILPLVVGAVASAAAPSSDVQRQPARSMLRRLGSLWAWIAIASSLLGTLYINAGAAHQVGVTPVAPRPLMDSAERALQERVGRDLPRGALVIGDPATGVAYLPLEAPVDSVFTQMNMRDVDEDGIFLADNFAHIHDDPRVCTLIRYYGIGYFYEDEPLTYNYSDRAETMPGFYGVDTRHGFTLIDQGGTAKLWRIDACGPIDPPENWWQRRHRRSSLIEHLNNDAPSGNPLQPE